MDGPANKIASVAQHGAGHTRYRRDIDGLRSIAVVGVVLYHFAVWGFGGGYIGVDVFFVISGFLIGRSIISDMRAGDYSLIGFYERRIRRLYPAFFFVAAVSAVAFYFLLLPWELRGFGRSLVAAVFYVSNIAFYKDRGYFDASAIDKPLLHTWSLSVEEQFYIVFPLLVYYAVRWRAAALPLIILLTALGSFVAAQWTLSRDADAAFYLFPYRAWELLIGVGLTLMVDRKVPPWIDKLREPIAIAGVAMIFGPILLYTHDTPFPALAALPPCLGSGMVIIGGSAGTTLTNRLLATRVPVFVGLVSYSFYLWHWPVLVGLSYYFGELNPLLSAAGIVLSFAMAVFSWRFVERPPRRKEFLTRAGLFACAATLSLVLASVGFLFYWTNGVPGRFGQSRDALIRAEQDFIQTGGTCFEADNQVNPGLPYCRLGAPSAPVTFLVWGDSHGRAYRDGIDQLARELGKGGLLVWGGGCPPLFDTGKHEVFDSANEAVECRHQNQQIAPLLARTPTLRTAILIGRWSYYTEGTGTGRDLKNRIALIGPNGRKPTSLDGQRRLFDERFVDTVDRLRKAGLAVFVLEQTPEFPRSNASIIAREIVSGRLSEAEARRMTQVSVAELDERQSAAQALFASLGKERKITILPTHSLFCETVICSSWFDGAPAMFDNNHVTVTTSRRFRKIFLPAIEGKQRRLQSYAHQR